MDERIALCTRFLEELGKRKDQVARDISGQMGSAPQAMLNIDSDNMRQASTEALLQRDQRSG